MFLLFLKEGDIWINTSKFTFQYVSIISLCHPFESAFYHDLHSNMFLLFHFLVLNPILDSPIFTFQYVSIIS